MKDYQIFIGEKELTTITTKTRKEAFAYACGLVEGLRISGRADRVTVWDEAGKNIFSRTY